MIATLWVSPFTEIGIVGGAVVGLILFAWFFLIVAIGLAGRSESAWLGWSVVALVAAAALGVAVEIGEDEECRLVPRGMRWAT